MFGVRKIGMRKFHNKNIPVVGSVILIAVSSVMVGGCGGAVDGSQPVTRSRLFLKLPDTCPTPDGLAKDKDGNIILACPNYGDMSTPAVFMKIDKQANLSLYAVCPILEETGRACPMGIDIGPDGGLYVCDNQPWPGTKEGQNAGRLLKLTVENGRVVKTEVIAYGMAHPNGVRYHNGKVYVTQSMLPNIKSKQLVSAVYRFDAWDRDIRLSNDTSDDNLLAAFKTYNMSCQYGLDGLVFDSKGNLYVGNFGDGTIHKIVMGADGKVVSNSVFAKSPNMRTTDGICVDENDNIYVADFSENAVCKVTPDGKVRVLARSPDCDGSKGGLDQPGEPIVRGDKLLVSCFDMVTGPDKVNTKHDFPHTIAYIDLGPLK